MATLSWGDVFINAPLDTDIGRAADRASRTAVQTFDTSEFPRSKEKSEPAIDKAIVFLEPLKNGNGHLQAPTLAVKLPKRCANSSSTV